MLARAGLLLGHALALLGSAHLRLLALHLLGASLDLDLARLRLHPLRQLEREDPALEVGLDVLRVHRARQRERAAEATVGRLDAVIPLAVLLLLELPLTAER